MKRIRRSLAVLALLALAFWLWRALFPDAEKVIRKQIAGVAKAASFAGSEGLVAQAARVAELVGYFSPDAEIAIEPPGHGQYLLSGRGEIQQAALAARKAVRSLTVELLDVYVTLAGDGQSATADLTARVNVPGERHAFVQEMKFVLKKLNDKWLIVRVETVKTLSRSRENAAGRVTPRAPRPLKHTMQGTHSVPRPAVSLAADRHARSA